MILTLLTRFSMWRLSRERSGKLLIERNAKRVKVKYLCWYRPDSNIDQDQNQNKKD